MISENRFAYDQAHKHQRRDSLSCLHADVVEKMIEDRVRRKIQDLIARSDKFSKSPAGLAVDQQEIAACKAWLAEASSVTELAISSPDHPYRRRLHQTIEGTSGGGILQKVRSASDIFEAVLRDDDDGLLLDARPNIAAKSEIVVTLAQRFHRVARQLRHRQRNRAPFAINDEYDVQDIFHALLQIHFDDVRPEEYTPSHAGAASRMDFLLPEIESVVEIKMMRDTLSPTPRLEASIGVAVIWHHLSIQAMLIDIRKSFRL